MSGEGPGSAPVRIGVVSDTHGELALPVLEALRGVDAIVHAGDVCAPDVLYLLGTVAPLTAVRGNCDTAAPLRDLPDVANVVLGRVRFLVAHQAFQLMGTLSPEDTHARVVVTGHTHVARIEERDGALWVNPGSASAANGADATIAIVSVAADGGVTAEIVAVG